MKQKRSYPVAGTCEFIKKKIQMVPLNRLNIKMKEKDKKMNDLKKCCTTVTN